MSNLIHGDNLEHKIRIEKQPKNKKLLNEIKAKYSKWKEDNLKITGTTKEDIKKKVKLLNEYKIFIDQPKFKKEAGNKIGHGYFELIEKIIFIGKRETTSPKRIIGSYTRSQKW